MTRSPASTRAYEKATLTCGLLSVPISVFTATANDVGIKRNQFTAEGHPVGNAAIDKITNEMIDRADIVKKIATEKGPVFVEDYEIEALLDVSPKSIVIKGFQPRTLLGTAYVTKSPYFIEVTPTTVGKKKVENKAGQQALAVILAAMAEEDAIALVEFTTRGVPKPAVLLPDGSMWCVYFDSELREQRPMPEVELSEQLLEQGRAFVKMLWNDEPEELTDERSARIQELADSKAAAGNFEPSDDEPAVAEDVTPDEPVDLMALLSASVEAAKKVKAA